jgi:hypothetical protein
MPQNAFRRGFLDGWSFLRGDEPAPPAPAYSIELGSDPYRAGVALGTREACSKARLKSSAATKSAIDSWLDNALRRFRRH